METNHVFAAPRPVNGKATSSFEPSQKVDLPTPTGKAPFRLDIKKILPALDETITKMVFHTVGDTGGIVNGVPQTITASKMEDDLSSGNKPSFFYHLGDVAYYNAEDDHFYEQFFKSYENYMAPILAIAGNHDSSWGTAGTPKSWNLDNFMKVFCEKTPGPVDLSRDVPRTAMIQPNVYWTLQTPLANFIGLYTNNGETEGYVNDVQAQWFYSELKNAQIEADKKAIIVALHHPPYSVDNDHGASRDMKKFLQAAFEDTGVYPDIILSGHVHNYQRFTVSLGDRKVPVIVTGGGGYYNLSYVGVKNGGPVNVPNSTFYADAVLENYNQDRHGFLKITIDISNNKRLLSGEYFTVPRPQESWSAPAAREDYFITDLDAHTVKNMAS
ncbi:MAG TPA: metallophosphoesterase [Mucilaginibacter sp.]|jgi:predicted phosphodiesterase